MKIIRQAPNPSGAYPSIQDWFGDTVPDDMAVWPDSLDTADFYRYNGFVKLKFESVDNVPTVADCTCNSEAWEAWKATLPPAPDPLQAARDAKLPELSAACNKAIVAGCDVVLTDGTVGHISLTNEDQINLTNAVATVEAGASQYPYHLDGELCAMYPAADILVMGQAATAHKLYHTTYYNHLAAWVRRCETVEDIEAIEYGAELPDDLKESLMGIISATNQKSPEHN